MFHSKILFKGGNAPRTIVTCAQSDPQGPRRQRNALQSHRHPPIERGIASSAAFAAAPAVDDRIELELSYSPHRTLNMLSRYRALVLDSAYRPIDVVHWQRAICMDVLRKVDVLEYYETTVNSVSEQFFLPAVMRARWYGGSTGRLGRVALNRRNIMLRDNFACQYCGKTSDLTLDHVVPQSRGGPNSWTNLVTACAPCNAKKGDKTLKQLKWKLVNAPREPSPWELNLVMAAIGAGDIKNVPTEWSNYLFYGSSSEEEEVA